MALSRLTFPSRGVGPYPLHGLDYLTTDHLVVLVDDVEVAATFDDVRKSATLAVAASSAATVVIQRTTPRRQEDRLTQFLDLPDNAGGLSAALLDQDARQNMLLMQEGRDAADDLDGDLSGMGLNASLQWAGQSKRVEGLSLGASPQDMLRKDQLDLADASVRNLPTVGGGDNDDGLMVVAGEWDDTAPAAFRTGLGLGTVATLAAGVAANDVAQFSPDSPPRYPTADGRNIDLTNHPIQTQILQRSLATVVRWGAQNIASPAVDPGASATWSQNASTRVNLGGGWVGRTELNNSGAVDGSVVAPYSIRLVAGTWRVRWMFKVLMPLVNSATNRTSLRLTNDDDTSSQIVYYDLGLHRPSVDFVDVDYSIFPDSVLLTFGSPTNIVFRYSNRFSGGNNFCNLMVLIQRIVA